MRTLPVSFLLLLFVWSVCAQADSGRIRQKRAWIIDSFSIEEEHPGPFPYKLGRIELDRSYLVKFELHGQGVDKDPKNILKIDHMGDIYVYGKVDYESAHKILLLTFEAINQTNNAVDTRLAMEIKILDINDNAPKFQKQVYEVSVDEKHAQGEVVLTVLAFDDDDPKTNNGTFTYTIKSVTPETDNVEFYIEQTKESGKVYFRGCLDYEKAQKYKILVEAKDNGDKIQLSSTSTLIINILDNNNNLPEFTGKTGPGKVKERESGVEVLRLQVTDKDSPGSKAWKAKYTIHKDIKELFQIKTDPDTNDGILTVVKPLDYEEQTYKNLSISVQNEIPYFSCKVKKKVPNAMWELDKTPVNSEASVKDLYKTINVTIYVEDVNDPPVFIPPIKHIAVMENIDTGTNLTTFTAKDMDGSHANTFKYVKGEDTDGWITVDALTGQVSTAKVLDRESPFVINSTYNATIYAVDEGEPQMTGTATLFIHLSDQNDNLPILEGNTVNMCLNTEPTMANITAVDLDLPPYSSPFYYELLGDVKDKWRVEPKHGTTVSLVKENRVFSGHYLLQIKISDQQGFNSIQNLSVTVCDCSITPNCHVKTVSKARMGLVAALMVVLAVLMLIAICAMALLITCKEEKKIIESDDSFGYLIKTNTENPGTDCKVPFSIDKPDSVKSQTVLQQRQKAVSQVSQQVYTGQAFKRTINRNSTRSVYKAHSQRSSFRSTRSNYSNNVNVTKNLAVFINQRVLALQTRDDELCVYEPHCYADEGQCMTNEELDAISIPEKDFNPDMLGNLDSRFRQLATISRPDLMRR